ncbi:hypothetical protein [Occallatibacter savannae]|uniref:hypothetical protein n=1 Tax=Occallatibacter savannae TaxID=1002691 RepID=UPI000D6A00A8|nr:hypothetical protein [Occallatibacter savannae]
MHIAQLAAWQDSSKEEKLRTRLLLKKPGGRAATGIVKKFGKEEKTVYQAFVSLLVGEHSGLPDLR